MDGQFGVDVVAEYHAADKPIKIRAAGYEAPHPSQGRADAKEVQIYDGQTVALMPFVQGERIKPARAFFVTATLIDAAGNRVNSPDDKFLQEAETNLP